MALNLCVTALMYQPFAPAVPLTAPRAASGAVLSMSMLLIVSLAVLPARSVTLLVTLWLAPSPKAPFSGQPLELSPEPPTLSEQLKLTVTSSLYQPLALAARSREAVMVGAVLSMSMLLIVSLAVLPARSVTLLVTLWLAPSPKTTFAGRPLESTPEPPGYRSS